MASGLFALLDDVAAIVKATAASIDDVAVQAIDASGRAAGVVIDDAAVTPKYVVGLSPQRELPIIWNIAKGSLRNKLLILMPALLLLGLFAKSLVLPLLAVGALYLCFEGAEKLLHLVTHALAKHGANHHAEPEVIDPETLEKMRTQGAIRTDFILSAEIMAIAFNEVAKQSLPNQIAVLLVVALVITGAVYGFVALVLKADDIGMHMAKQKGSAISVWVGRLLIHMMSPLLKVLSIIGTLAMLWVGGQILVHATEPLSKFLKQDWLDLHHWVEHQIHDRHLTGFWAWLVEAGVGLVVGLICGLIVIAVLHGVLKVFGKRHEAVDH